MRVNKLVVAGSLVGVLFSLSSLAQSQKKSCPIPYSSEYALTDSEFTERLERPELVQMSSNMSRRNLEQFLFEYEKFPASLRNEIARAGGKIHMIEGNGVAEDPTWYQKASTGDGRDYFMVPGSGGFVYSFPKVPTRIVINRLYDRSQTHGHGSVNLLLHEHAHTLDNVYSEYQISSSRKFNDIISEPSTQLAMIRVCGMYCSKPIEAFAELFAYYHACPATKAHMEQELPTVAQFMAGLSKVKSFNKKESEVKPRRRQETTTRRVNTDTISTRNDHSTEDNQPRRRRRSFREFFRDVFEGIEDLVDPDHDEDEN